MKKGLIIGALCLLVLVGLSGAVMHRKIQDAIPLAFHASSKPRIYTGTYVPLTPWLNALLGLGPHYDFSQLASFEKDATKGASLAEVYQSWADLRRGCGLIAPGTPTVPR